MSIETPQTESVEVLLDNLQQRLQTQIDKVRINDYRSLEAALQETGSAITEISENKLFQQPQCRQRLAEISKLYRQLTLSVAVGKDTVEKQLQKIGRGKKTVQAYRRQT